MTATEVLLTFVGWVALLLWGVRMVRTGITRSFTTQVRGFVSASGRNRFAAAGIGLSVAALLQSSTATGLIVSSLVTRSIVQLPAALAVMLGADVGTAVAAFIFSVRVVWIAPLLLAIGVFGFLSSSDERRRQAARIGIGLGLTLLALTLIGNSAATLRQSPELATVMSLLEGQPLIAFLLGAGVTWLAHSSLSTVILVMSLAASGVVSLPLAFALVLGANVGGALAPYVDQIAAPPPARRVMLGNLIMRGAVAAVALAVLLPFAPGWLKPLGDLSAGHAVLTFHAAFNLMTAILFLPFTEPVANFLRKQLPDPVAAGDASEAKYLDPQVIEQPAEALAAATRETLAVGDLVAGMLDGSLTVFEKNDARGMKLIEKADNAVDRRYEAIKLYMMKVSHAGMSEEDSRRFVEILTFITNLEHIGDIIDKNLMELAAKKIRHKLAFSPEGLEELHQFHARVRDNMQLAFNVFNSRDVRLARKLLSEKPLLREAEVALANSHFSRLRAGRAESIETSAIHLDIIRDLKRINSHLTSVAYPILETAGELLETRLRQAAESEEERSSPRR